MLLLTALATAQRNAHQLKQYACRRRPHDTPAVIDCFRGDALVATVVPIKHKRDLILTAFDACQAAFDADLVVLAFETIIATRNTNPMTGQQWNLGELNEAFRAGGIEHGWVQEAIALIAANRAGDVRMLCMPFRYAGGHLVWLPIPELDQAMGIMPDAVREAMLSTSLGQVLPLEHPQGDRDAAGAVALQALLPCQVWLGETRDRHRLLAKHATVC